ncbi:NADPH-dependent FMN reductase [Phreatobacter sp.]|uniref:NADPH-dependent FMN reductase n=1 Tax=Phreatobacter sp. TaxID=1966341 RepID=UPI003F72AF7B
MPMTLQTIITSTRPGRVGPQVARWMNDQAAAHGGFTAELVDLADFDLPVFDEPKHPRLGQYEHAHTQKWSETVKRADAFVFVTPEYNYGVSPAFLNALTYLATEWAYKPAGFAGYGGLSGGLRAIQSIKPIVTTLKMMPLPESVAVPGFGSFLGPDATFKPNDMMEKGAKDMLDELAKWAGALKPLRG